MATSNLSSFLIPLIVIVGLYFLYTFLTGGMANSGGGVGYLRSNGSSIMIFIVGAIAIYYFYKWLKGDPSSTDVILFTAPKSGIIGVTENPTMYTTDNSDIPAIYSGGEFSVSTWIYISNWTINKGFNKPFLQLNGGGSTNTFQTLVMYLGQNTSKLGVRVSTDSQQLTLAELDKLRPVRGNSFGTSPYTDSSADFSKCDIESVDLQRWVNITAVLNGTTLDVYIDGKMSRSCVLPGTFSVSGSSPTLALAGPFGFGGIIGTTRIANFAYSPDRVYQIYQTGPLDRSFWTQVKSYFSNTADFTASVGSSGKAYLSDVGTSGQNLMNRMANL